MPPPTTMRTLLEAIRTGSTNITRSLEKLFADPSVIGADRHFDQFRTPGHCDALDAECINHLGVTPADIDHINAWPNDLKEEVRAALVDAVDGKRSVRFSWKLSTGTTEDNQIRVPAAGDVAITFRSPEGRVQAIGTDEVRIEVGPAGPRTVL